MSVTTIQLDRDTRERLSGLKSSPRDTYDALINRLMDLLPEGDDEGLYTDAFRVGLLEAQLDIRAGRTTSHADVKRRFGIR